MCVNVRMHFKKLTYSIVEAGKSKIFRVGWQVEEPGKFMLHLESEANLEAEFPLPGGMSVFFSLNAFKLLDETTHIMEANLLYSKSVNLNVDLI